MGGAVARAFIAAPFYSIFADNTEVTEAVNVSIDLGFWSTSLIEPDEIAIVLVPLGILIYFLLVHVINLGTALHATWACLMLGSRAEPIPLGPGGELPPLPSGDEPPPDEPPPGGALDPTSGSLTIEDSVEGDPVAPALEEWPELPGPDATPLLAPPGEEPSTDVAARIEIAEPSERVPPTSDVAPSRQPRQRHATLVLRTNWEVRDKLRKAIEAESRGLPHTGEGMLLREWVQVYLSGA